MCVPCWWQLVDVENTQRCSPGFKLHKVWYFIRSLVPLHAKGYPSDAGLFVTLISGAITAAGFHFLLNIGLQNWSLINFKFWICGTHLLCHTAALPDNFFRLFQVYWSNSSSRAQNSSSKCLSRRSATVRKQPCVRGRPQWLRSTIFLDRKIVFNHY